MSLAAGAVALVREADLASKIAQAKALAKAWHHRRLSLGSLLGVALPDLPGRPAHPVLLAPRDMPKRRGNALERRIAQLHALAHIELQAVDMTWDLISRSLAVDLPRSYYDDWVRVGVEEAKHFELLCRRLEALGSYYGALPAHDGLWQTAQATADDLTARL
ncbi:MAG: DUF455 family protein, partial [Pseudomonadota bacterium]